MAASSRSRVGGCDVTCIRSIRGRLIYDVRFRVYQPTNTVISGFEPGTLRTRSRDLTTRPQRPSDHSGNSIQSENFRQLYVSFLLSRLLTMK
ncbi:hypothetical protein AVEN_165229-1 [Araneus ventricosus]|uniref:Uncharacterized protein n=1 Tax=Araneus ventricosus TaxID=182803 RepID=A0A4Y2B5I3_ARAVE|nr:hypothetical protein AVEN_165229-1 [Araneus ventricosus]